MLNNQRVHIPIGGGPLRRPLPPEKTRPPPRPSSAWLSLLRTGERHRRPRNDGNLTGHQGGFYRWIGWSIATPAKMMDLWKNPIPTIFICIFIVVIWLRSIFWVVCGGFMLFQVRSPKRIGSICCSHFGSFVGTFNLNPKLGPAEPSSLWRSQGSNMRLWLPRDLAQFRGTSARTPPCFSIKQVSFLYVCPSHLGL